MSDSYLFQSSKTGFQFLVFGINVKDAREYAKNTHPSFDMKFVSKNPGSVSKYVLSATTENQMNLNRESFLKRIGVL